MTDSSEKITEEATPNNAEEQAMSASNVEDMASNDAASGSDNDEVEKSDDDYVYEDSPFGSGMEWDGTENDSATDAAASLAQNDNQDENQAEDDDLSKAKKRPPPPRKTPEERGLLPQNEEEKQERSMTLMEHLGELRTRLVRAFIAIGLAFSVCYTFSERLFAELCKPLIAALPEGSKLIFTALPEAFFVYLKVGLVAAVFVASPYLFYQIWSFIAPGLYDEEKKYVVPMALISAIFFISGASFCFFVVFPYAFTFFVSFASEEIAAMPSLGEYLGFSLKLLIAFGLIFEMPLFTFFLSRMGLVTADRMRNFRRYAVLCIFIIAAILTPPDVISQLLMAMPMMLLYEVSIGVAAAFGKKKKTEAEEVEEDLNDNENAKETG